MAIADVVKQVAETLEKEGNSKAVFGELVKLEHHSIIPVAVVRLGGGMGGANRSLTPTLTAGGGGLGFAIVPVGFIQERGGQVEFTPIHVDVQHKPFLTEASTGLGKAIDTVLGIVSGAAGKMLHRPAPPPS